MPKKGGVRYKMGEELSAFFNAFILPFIMEERIYALPDDVGDESPEGGAEYWINRLAEVSETVANIYDTDNYNIENKKDIFDMHTENVTNTSAVTGDTISNIYEMFCGTDAAEKSAEKFYSSDVYRENAFAEVFFTESMHSEKECISDKQKTDIYGKDSFSSVQRDIFGEVIRERENVRNSPVELPAALKEHGDGNYFDKMEGSRVGMGKNEFIINIGGITQNISSGETAAEDIGEAVARCIAQALNTTAEGVY